MAELRQSGDFSLMQPAVDEDEHSIEMHLPYLRHVFRHRPEVRFVPVLVGGIDAAREAHFGRLLAPYVGRPRTLVVVSSDFCHWGMRFSYTRYEPAEGAVQSLGRRDVAPRDPPIHASIEALDRRGMAAVARQPVGDAHAAFSAYLRETRNTVCGRHPIGVLLAALAALPGAPTTRVHWVRYDQSSAVTRPDDSSVSYASAVVTT